MNPFGFVIIGLALILIIIGFKGSQHEVLNAVRGIGSGGGGSTESAPPDNSSPGPGPGSGRITAPH